MICRMVLFALSLALTLMAIGCFEFTEEIWLRSDRSCRLHWDIAVSEAVLANDPAMSDQLREQHYLAQLRLGTLPGVMDTFLQEYSDEGLRHFTYEIELEHIYHITDVHKTLADQAPLHHEGTPPEFRRLNGRQVRFTQVLADSKPQFGQAELAPPPWQRQQRRHYEREKDIRDTIVPALLADKYVTVRLHAPMIGLTNGRVNRERTTVEWKVSLAQLAAGNPVYGELQADVSFPYSWTFWLGVALPVFVLAAGAIILFTGKRKKAGR